MAFVQASQMPEEALELELPSEEGSVGQARMALAQFARAAGADEESVKLAVSEAVGNAVVHAFRGRPPGLIKVGARTVADRLLITIADDGIGMSPNVESPGLGFGISLITKVAREVRFESTPGGTTVLMEFELAAGAA